MAANSLGLIELTSIAAGYAVTDAMLKAADVELVLARTICSGKYMVLIKGDVAGVEAAVAAGRNAGDFALVDSFVIANVDDALLPALGGAVTVDKMESLGIVETFSVASLIEAADAMAKSANVRLVELRLAMALGGKAYAVVTGAVGAVRTAVEAGARVAAQKGLLVNKVVVSNPRPELLKEMI